MTPGEADHASLSARVSEAGAGAQMSVAVAVGYAQLRRSAEAAARLLLAIERHDPGVATLV